MRPAAQFLASRFEARVNAIGNDGEGVRITTSAIGMALMMLVPVADIAVTAGHREDLPGIQEPWRADQTLVYGMPQTVIASPISRTVVNPQSRANPSIR